MSSNIESWAQTKALIFYLFIDIFMDPKLSRGTLGKNSPRWDFTPPHDTTHTCIHTYGQMANLYSFRFVKSDYIFTFAFVFPLCKNVFVCQHQIVSGEFHSSLVSQMRNYTLTCTHIHLLFLHSIW